jgi:hypothetical protein
MLRDAFAHAQTPFRILRLWDAMLRTAGHLTAHERAALIWVGREDPDRHDLMIALGMAEPVPWKPEPLIMCVCGARVAFVTDGMPCPWCGAPMSLPSMSPS